MNIRDLKYIVAVAELEHFTKAAQACFVSQPALSGQIQKLEDRLNVQLFERTKRAVKITPAGEQIIIHAKAILDLVDQIEETAKSLSDPFAGLMRVGMIPTIGPYLTPALLPAVTRGLPQLELKLSEDITPILERELIEGQIDAAFLATPTRDSRLTEISLYDEPFWIALPNKHPLAEQDMIDVYDISMEEFLLLEDGHCFRDQILSFCKTALSTQPNFKTQNTSLTTILALVGAGAGVTLVPAISLSGSWVTDSGIALRREKTGSAFRSVILAFRKSFPRRVLLDRLADIVCAVVPDTVYPVKR